MSSSGPPPYVVAAGKIAATTPPTIISGSGISAAVRNAKGDFSVTITTAIDLLDRAVVATANATAGTIAVANEAAGTDTTVNFLIADAAAAAADVNFSFVIFRTD